jgi:hypothetical protein
MGGTSTGPQPCPRFALRAWPPSPSGSGRHRDQAEIEAPERSIKSTATDYPRAGLPADLLKDAPGPIKAELAALQARRSRMVAYRAERVSHGTRIARLEELARTAAKRLPRMSLEEHLPVLSNLAAHIVRSTLPALLAWT